jgi:hypothetical protein
VLSTLSTVGYGDVFPISITEKLFSIVIMLCGVAFFSYIMNSFIEILSNYKQKLGSVNKTNEFSHWLLILSQFTR